MSYLRAFATLIIVGIIILLAAFQMQLRGYEEIERINGYVLYQNTTIECQNIDYDNNTIVCHSQYILKDGFSEYQVIELLEEGTITISDISPSLSVTND